MDNLLSTAVSFLQGSKSHGSESAEGERKPGAAAGHDADSSSSYGDVYGSGQVLMSAAKARMGGGESNEADMGEIAGAAADLIGAASHYGHLEKTSYGAYVEKAEAYLHDYQAKHGGLAKPGGGNIHSQTSPHLSAADSGEECEKRGYSAHAVQQAVPSHGYFEEQEQHVHGHVGTQYRRASPHVAAKYVEEEGMEGGGYAKHTSQHARPSHGYVLEEGDDRYGGGYAPQGEGEYSGEQYGGGGGRARPSRRYAGDEE